MAWPARGNSAGAARGTDGGEDCEKREGERLSDTGIRPDGDDDITVKIVAMPPNALLNAARTGEPITAEWDMMIDFRPLKFKVRIDNNQFIVKVQQP